MRAATAPVWCALILAIGGAGALLWKQQRGGDGLASAETVRLLANQERALKRIEALELERRQLHRQIGSEQALVHLAEQRPAALAAEPSSAPAAAGDDTKPELDEPTAEQLLGDQRARDLLDDAVRTGRWGESARKEFRDHFRHLTGTQQGELVRQLNLAALQGKLKFDPTSLPI